ncbi:4'-phosphopantetheinyl transferase superfamily protein [Streptomyces sp. NPDC003753]
MQRPAELCTDVPWCAAIPCTSRSPTTAGLCLVAFASTPVGTDMETVPDLAVVDEVGAVSQPRETAELSGVDAVGRPFVSAQVWARKEAYLKGFGTGLGRAHRRTAWVRRRTGPPYRQLDRRGCGRGRRSRRRRCVAEARRALSNLGGGELKRGSPREHRGPPRR